MIDSYWDLYVAYVYKCVADNWANDIDPAHYEMEWNHFLPRCIFGDWPIGHYLTLKQHAIATALQTLALKKSCLCAWHLKYLPTNLELLTRSYRKAILKENGLKIKELQKGIFDPILQPKIKEAQRASGVRSYENKTGMFSPDFIRKRNETASINGKKMREEEIGIFSPEFQPIRREIGLRAKENETGIFDPKFKEKQKENGKLRAKEVNSQRWEDPDHPELGQHSPGTLTRMQKRRGLPHGKENRVKVK